MATYYFVGGEDHDFTKNGNCTVDTATTAARRTANARCSLKIAGSTSTDSWNASLSTSASSFWLTARMYAGTIQSNGNIDTISLMDAGGVRRLNIRNSSGFWSLVKRSSTGTNTTLATASSSIPAQSLLKLDLSVTYGVSGKVDFYVNGTLVISYTGDVTTDSATAISSFALGGGGIGGQALYWSEAICSDSDTRSAGLLSLTPVANGNTVSFDTGSVSSINEVTLDDTTLMSSSTAGQLAQFTVDSSGVSGNPAIKAVCVTARAAKGGTGPQNCKLNVRSGGVDYLSGSIGLPAALNRVQAVFTTNPGTSGPWAYTDLTAAGFNVGIRSEA